MTYSILLKRCFNLLTLCFNFFFLRFILLKQRFNLLKQGFNFTFYRILFNVPLLELNSIFLFLVVIAFISPY